MTCEQIRAEIAQQVTGGTAAEAVAAHLASCEACRAFQAETRELWKKMEQLKMEACPVGLSQQALARALQDDAGRSAHKPSRLERWPVLDYAVVTAAALLLVAALLEWSTPGRKHAPPPLRGTLAGDGKNEPDAMAEASEDEIHKALATLTTKLSDDNFDTRQLASAELEAFVRKSGQPAFDALLKVQAEWQKKGDAESRAALEKILTVLTSPTLVWAEQTGASSFQSARPVLSNGMLLLSSEAGLTAVDAQTGAKRWSQPGNFDHNVPLIVNANVVVCGREATRVFRIKDGAEVWRGPGAGQVSAAGSGDAIFVSTEAALIALSADGKQLWSLDAKRLASPSFAEKLSLVLVSEWGKAVLAVNAKTGEKVWELPLKGAAHLPPTVSGDRVYVSTGPEDQDGALVCLEAATGKTLWTAHATGTSPPGPAETYEVKSRDDQSTKTITLKQGVEETIGAAFETGERVIAQGNQHVFAYSKRDGSLLWQVPCDRFAYTSCSVDNGFVYAGADNGDLLAIKLDTGTLEWRVNLNALVTKDLPKLRTQRNNVDVRIFGTTGQPLAAGPYVYVTSESGATVAIRLPQFKRVESK